MDKEKFSISRVNLFLENPWKHYCKYTEKLKPLKDPEHDKFMDRGTVFHKAMELMAQGVHWSEAGLQAGIYGEEQGFCQEAIHTGRIAIMRYLDEYGADVTRNVIHTEYLLEYSINDGADYVGYIDAILDNGDGTVTLVDYKTYSTAPQEDKLRFSLQANVYMYVAKKLGFNVRSFVFDCVNPKEKLVGRAYKTRRIELPYRQHLVEDMWAEFVSTVEIIQSNPTYSLYKPTETMPDKYDYLYKISSGVIVESIDDYIKENFIC